MAGGGSGEEDNYWPGYVDALTSMTMVLTFIMMILGVVIFSMSQNVSKILVKQIAEAAKIDISGTGSLEKIRDQVIQTLKKQRETEAEIKDGELASQFPLRGEAQSRPSPSERMNGSVKLPSPPQANEASKGNLAGTTSGQAPLSGKNDELNLSPPPSPVNEDPNKTVEDRRVETATNNDLANQSSGTAVSGEGAIITVTFQKRVIQLDEKATGEFRTITASSAPMKAAKRVEIKGYADVSVMGVTEARRIAYYRAMLIRKQLMTLGFSPEMMNVRIEDSGAADGEIVRVFAR